MTEAQQITALREMLKKATDCTDEDIDRSLKRSHTVLCPVQNRLNGMATLKRFELEDKIAGQRLEIKRLNGVVSNLIEALRFYSNGLAYIPVHFLDGETPPFTEVLKDGGKIALGALKSLDTVPLDTKRLDWIEIQANWKRRNLDIKTCVPNSDSAWFEVKEWDTTRSGLTVYTIGDGMSIREAIDKAMSGGEVNHGSHLEEKEDAKPTDLSA